MKLLATLAATLVLAVPALAGVVDTIAPLSLDLLTAEGKLVCSGVPVTPRRVLTAHHCIEVVTHIKWYSLNGNGHEAEAHTFKVKAVKEDEAADLAVLEIEVEADLPMTPAALSTADLKVGDEVWAIGNPVGFSKTVAKGILAHLERRSPQIHNGEVLRWQLSITGVAPGSSGGGVFDSEGKLIGVVQSGVPGSGIVFISPLPVLTDFLADVVQ